MAPGPCISTPFSSKLALGMAVLGVRGDVEPAVRRLGGADPDPGAGDDVGAGEQGLDGGRGAPTGPGKCVRFLEISTFPRSVYDF